jgi:hypothetical protein
MQGHNVEKRADRGKSGIPRTDLVGALIFETLQEIKH